MPGDLRSHILSTVTTLSFPSLLSVGFHPATAKGENSNSMNDDEEYERLRKEIADLRRQLAAAEAANARLARQLSELQALTRFFDGTTDRKAFHRARR